MAQDTASNDVEGGSGKGPAGLKSLKVDGGMTNSDVTMQIQSDILGINIERPTMREFVPFLLKLLVSLFLVV